MTYNFKNIEPIPSASSFIDVVLSKTQRKTPTVVHPGYKITRIRKFYMRKVKFTASNIHEKFQAVVTGFPKLDDIHPFYSYLMNILFDRDHYKLALGHLKTCENICDNIARDYVRLLKYSDSLYRCKMLKKAALGRMATAIKKLKATLSYLEEVRQHIGRMPAIDPNTRTLILCGYPNVGKSSFMNNITHANVDVQAYEFTTQALYVGHTEFQFAKWQVIDTPGILDHPLDKRNQIEMQAIAALAHINACILFFVDVSQSNGRSIKKQIQLFESVKPLLTTKPLVIVANKVDIVGWEQLKSSERKSLENLAQQNNGFLIKMSNKSGVGINSVKETACNILLDYRLKEKSKSSKKFNDVLQKIHVGLPQKTKAGKPVPQPHIPETVLKGEKRQDLGLPTVKQVQDASGGAGVFSIPSRSHFILEEPDWKDDMVPEIMDGKNISDFVDKDIMRKLEELEKEQEGYTEYDKMLDQMSQQTDEELVAAVKEVTGKKSLLRQEHQMKNRSQIVQKKIKMRQMERKFKELGLDGEEIINKKLEEQGPLPRRSLLKKRKMLEQQEQQDFEMEVDGKEEQEVKEKSVKKVLRKKIEKAADQRLQDEVNPNKDEIPQEVNTRLEGKIKKRWNRNMWVNESDRKIVTQRPKHLFSGKRPKGHLDRR